MTSNDDIALRTAAFAAMQNAHAPYSRFCVGAAVRTDSGEIAIGCNVENAAYPLGICAEQAAVAAAIVLGARGLTALTIATDGPVPTPPCGSCRQVLAEFAHDLPIESHTIGGQSARWTLSELLPHPFIADHLRRTPR